MSGETQREDIRTRYDGVCAELNMDEQTAKTAWDSYETINNDYVLEGDHLEWLGCALYVAGQSSTMETIEGETSCGNNVSLTHILRSTKLSLIEFFKKIKKWQEMAKLVHTFQKRIDTLERKFEVASIIFTKYKKIFLDLFSGIEDRPTTSGRRGGRRKQGNKPCSTAELFNFGWTLYIHIKGQYPQINDDLVNSHHLLLCCMDMLFCCAVEGKRRDLVNPHCPYLPEDGAGGGEGEERMCVLTELCSQYKAIEKECRVIRDFFWRGPVKRMFEKKELTGHQPGNPKHSTPIDVAFVNMISSINFHSNQKALDREYEINMLANGDFDERMFLHPNASEEIGTPTRHNTALSARLMPTQTPPQHVQYTTPLLRRDCLTSVTDNLTPVSDATHSVTQLHLLLENRPPCPSEYLQKMCSSCTADPLPDIEKRVASFGEDFLKSSPEEHDATPDSFTKLRLHLASSLYYKLLHGIVQDEMEEKKCSISTLQIMLEHDLFHKALFAVCVEVVLFSYNSQSRVFPWVLTVFKVSAYHFYKLIEVAIKVEGDFSRSIIKHLNRVEEMVLGYLAWTSDSPLFDAIDAAGSVPSYEDVALPTITVGGVATPIIHPRIKYLGPGVRGDSSPNSFLLEQLTSPGSTARRQLFSPGRKPTTPIKLHPSGTPTRPVPIAPKPPGGGSGGGGGAGGGVTVTLLRGLYQQQQQGGFGQQLQGMGGASPGKFSPSPAKFDLNSPLRLSPVSMASAGTQTSPCRPMTTAGTTTTSIPLSFASPVKGISLSAAGHTINVALSPSLKTAITGVVSATKGSASSSSSSASLSTIPLSPPIPSVSITPSPSKTPVPPPHSSSILSTPSTLTPSSLTASTLTSASPPRPRRTGSLALFYRKVYLMAHMRIKDLCERLDQTHDFQQKVWTCFEQAMVRSADLLRDRHLDQLIMCSIYVMAKVLRLDITFQEIMKQYRHQPQAKSHIYRSVLLNNGHRQHPQPDSSSSSLSPEERGGGEGGGGGGGVEGKLTVGGTPYDHLLYKPDIAEGTRGDIIQFYNKVYIGLVKDFALKFSPGENEPPTLSPLPTIRKTTPSPRRLSRQHQIFVSPHTVNSHQLSPLAKKYVIQKSPAAQLHEINEVLRGDRGGSQMKVKRQLNMLEASPYTNGPIKRLRLEGSRPTPRKSNTLMEQLKRVVTERAEAVQPPPSSSTEE